MVRKAAYSTEQKEQACEDYRGGRKSASDSMEAGIQYKMNGTGFLLIKNN